MRKNPIEEKNAYFKLSGRLQMKNQMMKGALVNTGRVFRDQVAYVGVLCEERRESHKIERVVRLNLVCDCNSQRSSKKCRNGYNGVGFLKSVSTSATCY